MKKYNIILFSIVCVIVISCTNNFNEERIVTHKNYGWEIQNDSLIVDVDYKEFKSFEGLVNHIENVVCEDHIPRITLKNKEYIQHINISNPCYLKYICVLVKSKNIITIYNDTVEKQGCFYPLDSLELVIKRDLNNYGKAPSYADHPDKLLFKITYDTDEFLKFPETLKTLVDVYEKTAQKTTIKIWVAAPIPVPPPPPSFKE